MTRAAEAARSRRDWMVEVLDLIAQGAVFGLEDLSAESLAVLGGEEGGHGWCWRGPPSGPGGSLAVEVDVVENFRVDAVLVYQLCGVAVSVLLEHLELTAVVVLNSFGEGLKQGVGTGHGWLLVWTASGPMHKSYQFGSGLPTIWIRYWSDLDPYCYNGFTRASPRYLVKAIGCLGRRRETCRFATGSRRSPRKRESHHTPGSR